MAAMKPRTKAPQKEQLKGPLKGDLARYSRDGLLRRSVNTRSVYRYRGVLLAYQQALQGAAPSLESSQQFLMRLREGGFIPDEVHNPAWDSTTCIFLRFGKKLFDHVSMLLCNIDGKRFSSLEVVEKYSGTVDFAIEPPAISYHGYS